MRLIDADELKELICQNVYPVQDAFNSRDYGMFWTGGIEKAIDEAPTIDAEPDRCGHWVKSQDGIRCSECGHSPINRIVFRGEQIWEIDADKELRYCPKCGTQMYDEEGDQ